MTSSDDILVMTDRQLLVAYLTAVAALQWAVSLGEEPSIERLGEEVLVLGSHLEALGYDPTDVADLQRRLA